MAIIAILLYLLGMVYAHQFMCLVALKNNENPTLFVKILLFAIWPIQAAVLLIGMIWEEIIEVINRE